jgi:geranylgeranyl diphosphate synthase, type II
MDFENRFDVSENEYMEMIRLKTAVLLACSLKTGAMLANAPVNIMDQLYELGINIGLAFQLQDDLLDTFGEQETFGKKIGGDILANKKTYLLIKALELATGEKLKELKYWLEKETFIPEEKIKSIKEIFHQLNIKEIAENKIDFYYQQSTKIIDLIELPDTKKLPLISLMDKMLNRNF